MKLGDLLGISGASAIPAELQKRLDDEITKSIDRGRTVRRFTVLLCTLFLAAISIVVVVLGASGVLLIAVTVAAANLCVVWALMSVSASFNAHVDGLATILVYYGERGRGTAS